MRYFKTTNATRPYRAGGFVFEFEPIVLLGGSAWLGVLAADDPVASALAGANFAQVSEIDESEYDSIKKKTETSTTQLPAVGQIKVETRCSRCGATNSFQVRGL